TDRTAVGLALLPGARSRALPSRGPVPRRRQSFEQPRRSPLPARRPEEAKDRLSEAFAVALELGDDVDAGYAVSSTAQVLVRTGSPVEGERAARHALSLLAGRADHVNEIGNAQLVLGRALLDQGRLDEAEESLSAAEASARQMDSLGHRAAVWLAQGDLAAARGHVDTAATVYRRAAEAMQDVRF